MKKKTLALVLVLALVLALGLVALAEDLTLGVLESNAETTGEDPSNDNAMETTAEDPTEEPSGEPADEPANAPADDVDTDDSADEPAVETPVKNPASQTSYEFVNYWSNMTSAEINDLYLNHWFPDFYEYLDIQYTDEEGKILTVTNTGDQDGSLTLYTAYLTWNSEIVKEDVQTLELAPGETGFFAYDDSYQWSYVQIVEATYGEKSIRLPGTLDVAETPRDPSLPPIPDIPVDPSDFSAQASLHTFGKNNVVILEVENQGSTNSKVTVTGTYLDGEGNVIGTEEKTLDGFSAGWKNNFVFNPGYAFASFTYVIKAVKTDFVSDAEEVEIAWTGSPDWKGFASDAAYWGSVELAFAYHHEEEAQIHVSYEFLILDASGNVVAVVEEERDHLDSKWMGSSFTGGYGIRSTPMHNFTDNYPLSNFTVVIAFTEFDPGVPSAHHLSWLVVPELNITAAEMITWDLSHGNGLLIDIDIRG